MGEFLNFTVIGLTLGAIYAIAATGLVVTYTTSGIFNLAHGTVAMISSFVYWQLRFDDGWGGKWPAPLALVMVILVLAPAFGMIVERRIIRLLEGTSEITKLFVPIVLFVFIIGIVNWVWGDLEARRNIAFFGPSSSVKVGDVAITVHEIIAFVLAIALAVGIRVFLYRTVTGTSMRAVVDDRELLELNGGRPGRASMLSWAIGSSLAALAGILISSLPGAGALSTIALTLLVVNAFAAAIIGRLRSLPLTFAGAMILGLMRAYWDLVSDVGRKWGWLSGLRPALPVLLLFVVLLLLPQDRLRGATVLRTRERFNVPSMRQAVSWGAIFMVIMWMLQAVVEPAPLNTLSTGMALSIIALSLTLLTGYAGEINLAPMTFAGIGAIVAFQLDVGPGGSPLSSVMSVWGLVLAGIVAAAVGVVVALPALRLHGLYLGLATFSFAVLVSNLVFNQRGPLYFNVPFYGDGEDWEINLFTNGNMVVPRPNWLGHDFRGATNQWKYFLLMSFVFVLFGIGLIALRRSPYGRRLAAMRDSPAACATLGMNLVRTKLSVFALSSAIAAVGGVFWGAQRGAVSPDNFDIFASLPLFMLAVAGGIGYVSGAYLAGFFNAVMFVVMSQLFVKLGQDYPSFHRLFGFLDNLSDVMPAMLAITVARNPSGITSLVADGFSVFRNRETKPYLYAIIAAQALLWAAAVSDGINNWTLALCSIGLWIIGGRIVGALFPQFSLEPEAYAARQLEEEVTDPRAGLGRPFTPVHREAYDRALGIPSTGAGVGEGGGS